MDIDQARAEVLADAAERMRYARLELEGAAKTNNDREIGRAMRHLARVREQYNAARTGKYTEDQRVRIALLAAAI